MLLLCFLGFRHLCVCVCVCVCVLEPFEPESSELRSTIYRVSKKKVKAFEGLWNKKYVTDIQN